MLPDLILMIYLILSIQIIVLLLLCRIHVTPEASNNSTKLTHR